MRSAWFAVIFLLAFVGSAVAQSLESDMGNRLKYLSQTGILRSADESLSICRADRTLAFGPMILLSQPRYYVLSADGCRTALRRLTSDQFLAAQALGLIPGDLPVEPQLSRDDELRNAGSLAGLAAIPLIIFVILRVLRRIRHASRTTRKLAADRVLAAIVQGASIEEKPSAEVQDVMGQLYTRLTGRAISRPAIRRAMREMKYAEATVAPAVLLRGLTEEEAKLVLRAVIAASMLSGQITEVEHDFALRISDAIELDRDEFRMLMGQAAVDAAPYLIL